MVKKNPDLRQFQAFLKHFLFLYNPHLGMNNNERSDGNFNRNERNQRGNNQRGPRHWKDNNDDNGPQKNRNNNRNFDAQKDRNR